MLAYQRMLHDITPLRRMIIEMSYETWPQVGWATTPEATAIVKQRSCAAVELSLAKLEAVQARIGLAALPAPCCCQIPARCFPLPQLAMPSVLKSLRAAEPQLQPACVAPARSLPQLAQLDKEEWLMQQLK